MRWRGEPTGDRKAEDEGMGQSELVSPLRRARIGLEIWLARLPKTMTLDARMALDTLMSVAEREIDQAYRDGAGHRSSELEARRMFADAADKAASDTAG
jgi:hypothetical protein